MKRIIYSVWNDLTESHTSATDYKQEQFRKYKHILQKRQEDYAKSCNADYNVYNPDTGLYSSIQFYKLKKFEELSAEYDEILYLDLDVIPKTNINIFNAFDTNNICVYNVVKSYDKKEIRWAMKNDSFHPMDVWIKCSMKKSMLLLDNIVGSESIANTGVLLGNKDAIKNLSWLERLDLTHEAYNNALDDNLYPEEVTKRWVPNNEAFFSYTVEKYKVPMTDIGIQWNYILDRHITDYTAGVHFIHQVNKDFEIGLS